MTSTSVISKTETLHDLPLVTLFWQFNYFSHTYFHKIYKIIKDNLTKQWMFTVERNSRTNLFIICIPKECMEQVWIIAKNQQKMSLLLRLPHEFKFVLFLSINSFLVRFDWK